MITNIFKFAWRNIWRNKRRTLLTALAIAVGTFSIVFARSYIQGILKDTTASIIKTEQGHVKIAHKEFLRLQRIMPKEFMVRDNTRLLKFLNTLPQVDFVDARIKFPVLLNKDDVTETGLVMGVTPKAAAKGMELPAMLKEGDYITEGGLKLIIGKSLAKKLSLKTGQELLLVTTDVNYSTYALPFDVSGIFQSGYTYMDKHSLFIPVDRAREMLDCPDSAHELLIFIKDPAMAAQVSYKIKEFFDSNYPGHEYNVTPWDKSEIIGELLPLVTQIWGKILMIVMFIVALVILNTMLMAVMERFHEIGVMKAMGMKSRNIISMIFIEAFSIGAIGSVMGGIFGGALSAWVEKTGINFAKMIGENIWEQFDVAMPFYGGGMMYPDFSMDVLISSIIFGIVMTLVAVIFPAFKTARMQPVDAFRSKLNV